MNYENENNFLETLIKRISKLPGLGPRSARRIIFYLLIHIISNGINDFSLSI